MSTSNLHNIQKSTFINSSQLYQYINPQNSHLASIISVMAGFKNDAKIAINVLLIACLLVMSQPRVVSALTCDELVPYLWPCMTYVEGTGPLTDSCCKGVKDLNDKTKNSQDRRAVCNCLKKAASCNSVAKSKIVSGIPSKCGINIPYTISSSTDCSKYICTLSDLWIFH